MKVFMRKIVLLAVILLVMCAASWAADESQAQLSASIEPTITTKSLTSGYVSSPYGLKLKASGTSPITWTANGLPNGLTITEAGYISGTPTVSGDFSISVTAANSVGSASSTFNLSISDSSNRAGPSITTDTLDIAVTGEEYRFQLMARGTPPFTWSVSGGLPAGLTMNESGLITGTPAKNSKKIFTAIASNDFGKVNKRLTLNVNELPEITISELKEATVSKKYTQLINKKGSSPFTWKLDGTLPKGITFDTNKGKFSGTPTINGSADIRVTLSNAVGSVTKIFTLNVNAIPPKISPSFLKNGTWGSKYNASIKMPKGTKPITLTMEGDIPTGLTFNSSNGKLTGTPMETCENRELTLVATNMAGSVSNNYTITIKPALPKITTSKLNDAKIGAEYSVNFAASGTPPFTWEAAGLPEGLSLTEDGLLSGIPTEFGVFRVKIQAANDAKTVKKNYILRVLSAPTFDESGELEAGTEGRNYSYKLKTTGTKDITYSKAGGTLPNGVTLDSKTGRLSGKPTASGTFNFTVKAANSVGSANMDFTLTIEAKAAKAKAARDGETELHDEDTGGSEPGSLSVIQEYTHNNGSSVPNGEGTLTGSFIVAAELPEVSVDKAGMYEFGVELGGSVPVGAKLIWRAGSSVPSDDDNIAEFYDEAGKEVDIVPESRKLNVSAWLNPDRIYKPSIAIIR